MKKCYIAEIEERNGEYEYRTKYLFKTSEDPDKYNDNVAKTWRGDDDNEYDEDSNGYWSGGTLMCPGDVKKISPEHFKVLKKYLVTL